MERKVLLIDDEPSLRRSVSMGLMQKGYQTEPCENGMKALQTLEMFSQKKIPFNCAIVDVRLPDIDGLKLLKVLKANYPNVPVIIITGYGSEAITEEAGAADAFLEKPFSMDDLADIMEKIEPQQAQAGTSVPTPKEGPLANKSVSAYALVSLDNSANLLDTYRQLYFHQNVLFCDATRGDCDLVLLMQGDSTDEINTVLETEIRTVRGVSDISILEVQAPLFNENVIDIMGSVDKALGRDKGENEVSQKQPARIGVSSYVMLEVEKERMESVYPTLYFDDHVVNCDYAEGKFNVVLLMKGASFDEIGNTIKNRFRGMDGVLRIKEFPVISLFEA